jgi:hypothetical protein
MICFTRMSAASSVSMTIARIVGEPLIWVMRNRRSQAKIQKNRGRR